MNWFLIKLSNGLEKEDAAQIARLILWFQDEHRMEKDRSEEAGINAAMLADICEVFFNDDANRNDAILGHVPRVLSHAHAGWACGPGTKKEGESWLRTAMMLWRLKGADFTEEQAKNLKEWEEFLSTLKRYRA